MKKRLNRKGSVARKIQDYFLSGKYEELLKGKHDWCWFAVPNNKEFCVALEWQEGYDSDDKEYYGKFMKGESVVNVSIKYTDEFKDNGEYAFYAEYYFNEDADDELYGGTSLTIDDYEDDFYTISKSLAKDFNKFNRMKPRRDY